MSIQSKNRETLKAVRRENMKPEEYQNSKRLRAQGVYTMTDYIIPMPMETYESVLDGVSKSYRMDSMIKFNLTIYLSCPTQRWVILNIKESMP